MARVMPNLAVFSLLNVSFRPLLEVDPDERLLLLHMDNRRHRQCLPVTGRCNRMPEGVSRSEEVPEDEDRSGVLRCSSCDCMLILFGPSTDRASRAPVGTRSSG